MAEETRFHGYNGWIFQQAPQFIIGHEVIVLKAHFHNSEHNLEDIKLTFTYIIELSHSAQNGFIVPCKKTNTNCDWTRNTMIRHITVHANKKIFSLR